MNSAMYQEIVKAKKEEQDRHVQESAGECREAMRQVTNTSLGGCPVTWDGIMCWPSSSPGDLVSQNCPSYIVGFNTNRTATKQCMSDGEWFVRTATNRTWTNYSQCYTDGLTTVVIQFPDIGNASLIAQYIPFIKNVSHIGYGVSLVTLLVAFCIFATFKRLRCPRNKLHMHLFVSFMLRAFTTLLKDSLFLKGIGLASDFVERDGQSYYVGGNEYSWQCKMIVSLWQYCIMANYAWILMEGMYLHNLIFFAVFSDTSSIALYVILGWGLPLLFVVPWTLVRTFLEDTLCWTTNDNPYNFQLIKGPTTASILINVVLFLNIVRVLLSKLQASISEETRRFRYRRWAKSTLVLMPLFGVHYAVYLTLSYIGIEGKVELAWILVDQFFASFQGFLVAILYCLLNGEVRTELSKKWRRLPTWRTRVDRRGSLPLNTLSQQSTNRSYFGNVFSRKRHRYRSHQNGCKRGSNADTCMSSVMSSVTTDPPTTSRLMSHHRQSAVPENVEVACLPSEDSQLFT